MDTLPLETLEQIFELACTDGGYTGHSLSLVSKGIRAAARTSRFHSVSLIASPHRLQLFVALYKRECDPAHGDKPRIQHLYVAFPVTDLEFEARNTDGAAVSWPLAHFRSLEPAPSPLAYGNLYFSDPLVIVPLQPRQHNVRPSIWKKSTLAISRYCAAAMQKLRRRSASRRDHQATLPYRLSIPAANFSKPLGPATYEEYLSEAQSLFRLVAPDLVTLVVQAGFSYGGGGALNLPIFESPLPTLLEATFVGLEDPSTLIPSNIDPSKSQPLFPTMTHLYLAPAFHRSSGGVCLPLWFTHAPCVTHLGMSRADDYLRDIASAVGLRVEPEQPHGMLNNNGWQPGAPSELIVTPGVSAYPSVRYLLVQPGPGPFDYTCGCCGIAWANHHHRMDVLRQIERSCESMGIAAVEAGAPREGSFYSYYRQARRRWLERMHDSRDEAGGWSGSGTSVSRLDSREGNPGDTPSPSSSSSVVQSL
ncbi:uncharacterized protein TRAVEDRAFT_43513 [Trametes versicolor FP-101664 SS1]|uniref:uncharacterized protein n=1 Tax=Trametes versicolor (strain FP-101664) TaxID=717944 RepID=UPI0004623C82|nr:uncharacterized protein TRAVEDRAFT_43513 [Trametes versicolor FP-101664 SS1]EIW63209.1 hypothetical protein TRAVEDRAFT_43513 [Trametes versicolor FP-101664 SS1]